MKSSKKSRIPVIAPRSAAGAVSAAGHFKSNKVFALAVSSSLGEPLVTLELASHIHGVENFALLWTYLLSVE
jgi:hypothetical protein